MGTTQLRQMLTSLRNNSCWNYAVLWRLGRGNSSALTWEDGYVHDPTPRESDEAESGGVSWDIVSEASSSQQGRNHANGVPGGCPIGLVVSQMSHLQYVLGEGVVGGLASTGGHYWVSFKDLFSDELNQKLVSKCPDEWLLQFASGVKTILLLSVLPHGVLQLGSAKEVTEDINLVAYIRDRFNDLYNDCESTSLLTLNRCLEAQSPSTLVDYHTDNRNGQPVASNTHIKFEEDADRSLNLTGPVLGDATAVLPNLDEFDLCGKDLLEALAYDNRTDIDLSSADPFSNAFDCEYREIEVMENKLFEFSYLMEELQGYSGYNDYVLGDPEAPSSRNSDLPTSADMSEQQFGGKDSADITLSNFSNFSNYLTFPEVGELHKALGPAFREQTCEESQNQSLRVQDAVAGSSLICKKEPCNKTELSWLSQGADGEYLLEAVVSKAVNVPVDNPNTSKNLRITADLTRKVVSSGTKTLAEASALAVDDSLSWSLGTSAYTAAGNNDDSSSVTLKSMMSTIFKLEQQERTGDQMRPKKGQNMANASKRRAKPSDIQKPRPRDRQLIQDRVKELRELVPNGEKCSIDGLLERTIKHMLHLRSVSDQAAKLKQLMYRKVDSGEGWKSAEEKVDSKSGTSWALEFGNAKQVCPIVVEDLPNPGHMLIEMLCNEQGLFLEIAQVIRGLELTILKGVMEYRSDTIWAHFIVEASKGFHRLDIFWPLMQLLQRRKTPLSSKI